GTPASSSRPTAVRRGIRLAAATQTAALVADSASDLSAGPQGAFETLVQLTRRSAHASNDLQGIVREITEAAAAVLDCEGVAFWLVDGDGLRVRALDELLRRTGNHEAGRELATETFGGWLETFPLEPLVVPDLTTEPAAESFASLALPMG